jgi:hypothetical protein
MDGRILEEILEPEYLAAHPPVRSDGSEESIGTFGAVSDQDDAAMRDKLRGLGYID